MSERNQEKSQEFERDEKPQEFLIDKLFQFTMKKNWLEVQRVYKRCPLACEAKLTKTEETALHIAVSSYHPDRADANEHAKVVSELVHSIPEGKAVDILKLKNEKGDTPLHLAAALGSKTICESIAKQGKELINTRNLKGETPLFLAAHHGKMDAFRCLHSLYKDIEGKEPDESLCRRTKDGDTILHSAISGEYFELADQIIIYYPKLINSVNQEGFSPLHILARKPNLFQSSSNLRLFDQFFYRCVVVENLKKQTDEPLSHKISPCCRTGTYYPENYQTCMNFFSLPWAALRVIAPLRKDCGTGEPSSCIADEENPNEKDKEHEGKGFESGDSFPPNYTTCIQVFKLFINIVLTMLGIGIWRIGKITKKKEKHNWAVQIMTELIRKESFYKYDHNGRTPTQEMEPMYAERFVPPPSPPQDHGNHSSVEESSGRQKLKHKKGEHESRQEKDITETEEKTSVTVANTKNVKKETPILLAAKMGITEMVKMILETFPVAIQDLDVNEKNTLLLAVENRQTEVYDLLMKMKLPEFVLYQVDDEGNSALHLAAKFRKHQPWRIPGAALQMQWEIKWYKHVKHTMPPQCFIQYNEKGETASEIFRETHKGLVKEGSEWLIKTSESCSVVAALIATVAFATSATVPGGMNQNGSPILGNQPAFQVFSVASVVALCFSVTALVLFLAILTSRCQQQDFISNLPRKLLFGLSSIFTSIAAVLISFCAGQFFILKDQLGVAVFPIYTVACLPITFFAFAHLPLYFDLLWSVTRKVPLRSYKVYYH